jgi:hypothetical protein
VIRRTIKIIFNKVKGIPSFILALIFHQIYCPIISPSNKYKRKLIINSNRNYYKKTIPKLIKSLLKYGIKKEDIILMIGGCNKKAAGEYLNIKTYFLDNNSIDYTAFIGIIELELTRSSDFFFYIHDTIEIYSKKFYNIFYMYPIKKGFSYSITKKLRGMNIGFYSFQALEFNKEFILKMKNTNPSIEALQKSKSLGVIVEDSIFNNYLTKKKTFFLFPNNPKSKIVKYLGSTRIMEKYVHMGFLKYKANTKVSKTYLITLEKPK